MYKKSLVSIFIIFLLVAGFYFNNYHDKKVTKTQYEKMTGREISKEEWEEITKDGQVEIIGGADGPTSIYVKSSK
ncbi:hypothetical protein QP555_06975 [Peptoniphilus lacrimalis]|uniref:hypothetical protein n=1 Tax=Peptoniphilus lacrimalis TaxID=33031 RepID=UPI00254F30A6|nr:hypothetical protein [Peptoniphilus lacrimalis]MDK7722749.1 hypothetical protein [Peptoniphilus lacrimalis]MDK7732265.1 hypothetical protein [Peptoniphilus lacrimalis]